MCEKSHESEHNECLSMEIWLIHVNMAVNNNNNSDRELYAIQNRNTVTITVTEYQATNIQNKIWVEKIAMTQSISTQ